ncbi:MAG TPA: DPP IV N-terminal domain-containing protein [Pseudacidobacterium sp.]|jgi:dipeptidyl aminopeptidase/acylaminoacyl peptidase|nr:DPP IV N-terminal domain-containing protein [Pseudacidobacterium sp.]
MPQSWLRCALFLTASLGLSAIHFDGQVTRADYERAAQLRDKYKTLALNIPEAPSWIEKTDTFWYRKTVEGGHAFVLVDANTKIKKPAFDHDRLAAALSSADEKKYTGVTLPFTRFRYVDGQAAIELVLENRRWHCDLTSYKCGKSEPLSPEDEEYESDDDYDSTPKAINSEKRVQASPDGKWEAFIENYNVFVRAKGKTEKTVLSCDGSEDNYYALDTLAWSPDSRHLVAYRIRPGYRREVHYVESSPSDQLQPKYSTMVYPKAGDVLALPQPVLFDVLAKRELVIDNRLFPNPYELSPAVWWKDGRGFTFEYNQRGHQAYRVVEVSAATGSARALIDEESKTFIDYRPLVPDQHDTGKKVRVDIHDGKEILWASERDGWEHLYLYDGTTGMVKSQITKGNWVVRNVDYVDTEKRVIWFEASGMEPDKDPYYMHPYRINFDGTGMTPLSNVDADHRVVFSPDGKFYIDTWSRIDLLPVMELRSAVDDKAVMTVEQGDDHKLIDAGWRPPEVFTAKARDGKTDIWGVIYKPAHFDPSKKYPVVESIYAGPQGSFVPKSFGPWAQPLTELGFVVVQIDGMGTNNRSKAFHDVAWQNLKDAGFEDRILWHKAVAAKYSWYDVSRVGIFGTSAGGQSAMGALLFHPEFYRAAVSNSGSHDNRMDKIWWNEQWMGWPVGPQYAASSNVDNAYRLQGKLLLVVGEMDKNVDPSSTFQVVNALIKANKRFDLFYVPGGGHGAGGEYGQRLLEDFFVHNLRGQEPPDWNK